MRFILPAILLIVTVACMQAPTPDSFTQSIGPGVPRGASVAVAPLLDRAKCKLPWSVSAEITNGVRQRLTESHELCVIPREQSDPVFDSIAVDELYGRSLAGAKRLQGADFLVLMELTSHGEAPYEREQPRPGSSPRQQGENVMQLALRLRLVDLRGPEPRCVLQELVHSSQSVKKGLGLSEFDYGVVKWPSEGYQRTPVGRAHARLARDVAKQVERYVNYAQG